MFKLKVYVRNNQETNTLDVRYYKNFENAFSDIIDDDSPIKKLLHEDYGIEFDGKRPTKVEYDSVKYRFTTDFEFRYPNNVNIYVGEIDFEDDEQED